LKDCQQSRAAIASPAAFMITGFGVHDRPDRAFTIPLIQRSRWTETRIELALLARLLLLALPPSS